jgi:outer membrane lipoprotein SlyB
MTRIWLLPLLLAAGLAACDSGVNAGYVNTAAASNASAASPVPVGTGRVVAINDVSLRGSGGGGSGRGPLLGGLLGGLGGAAIGAGTSHTVGGGLIGGVLGAVGGAIAGTIFDNHGGSMSGGRGIEVTVQRDDGQHVTVAQRDDGDIQLGDRVQILEDRRGVPKVVRDTSRTYDRTAGAPPAQYGNPQDNGPPPDYSQHPSPQPQDDPRYGNLN